MIYLHLGQDTVVHEDSIIGVFDTDNTTQSHVTREYLRRAEKAGRVVDISGELPKSFVVCRVSDGGVTVYLSQLSSQTLLRRSESGILDIEQ